MSDMGVEVILVLTQRRSDLWATVLGSAMDTNQKRIEGSVNVRYGSRGDTSTDGELTN